MHAQVVETETRHGWFHWLSQVVDRWLHPVVRCDVCGTDIRLERSPLLPRGTAVVRRHDPLTRPRLRW